MDGDRRRQVFVAVAERGGAEIIVAPEAEGIEHGPEFQGYQGIQRHAWREVPGYPERVAGKLLAIMQARVFRAYGEIVPDEIIRGLEAEGWSEDELTTERLEAILHYDRMDA